MGRALLIAAFRLKTDYPEFPKTASNNEEIDMLRHSATRSFFERRRAIQQAYNTKHGITPTPAGKRAGNAILSFLEVSRRLSDDQLEQASDLALFEAEHQAVPLDTLPELIQQLEDKMKTAAKNLEVEEAANLRDKIKTLRNKLVGRG
jgi:excinuclease ABC subunit B